jgi:CRP-like cAMP-binding protein
MKKILKRVELFNGLSDDELERIAEISHQQTFQEGDIIASQGDPGTEFFIITEGLVEILVKSGSNQKTIVNLGTGQSVGEMSLIDQGPRSATVRAIANPTIVQVIGEEEFTNLCQQDSHIGYIVMRNIAADLSFKLRQRHLSERRG